MTRDMGKHLPQNERLSLEAEIMLLILLKWDEEHPGLGMNTDACHKEWDEMIKKTRAYIVREITAR